MQPSESLIRIIYSAAFWDEVNGVVKPAAFNEASNSGMSVTRLQHSSDDELQQQVNERIGFKEGRTFVKLISARFDEIAALTVEERWAFCCYDTPTPANHGHADVCQAHPPQQKSVRIAMRHRLQQLFTDYAWKWNGPDEQADNAEK